MTSETPYDVVKHYQVALFYYPQTGATSTAPAAECFTVRDGKISETVLIFDRLAFVAPEQDRSGR